MTSGALSNLTHKLFALNLLCELSLMAAKVDRGKEPCRPAAVALHDGRDTKGFFIVFVGQTSLVKK